MDVTKVIAFAKELRVRLDIVEKLYSQQQSDYRYLSNWVSKQQTEINNSSDALIEKFITQQKDLLLSKINRIYKLLDDRGVYFVKKKNVSVDKTMDIDTAKVKLDEVLSKMELICAELNKVDFDAENHPINYVVDEYRGVVRVDTVTKEETVCSNYKENTPSVKHLYDGNIKDLVELCAYAEQYIKIIVDAYGETLSVDIYKSDVANLKHKVLSEYRDQQESEYERTVNQLLVREDEKLNREFFESLREVGRKSEPDYDCGSDEFRELMTIGKIKVPVSDGNTLQLDKRLISRSPYLKDNVADGAIDAPMILNLKDRGNVIIETRTSDLSDDLSDFIHQYIQEFLLLQPSCRVNLCLTDFNDQCKFNRYATLKSINANTLYKGIIRNEREIDGVINELESLMYDIGDNKLSVNGVDNVFDYNQKSSESPQSIHLAVFLDFPEKYSADAITHIGKIIANGNRSGIFALLVHNTAYHADFGSRQANYTSALETIRKNSIIIKEQNGRYSLNGNQMFEPLKTLKIDNFAQKVFPILKAKAEEQKTTSIPMQDMFDASDVLAREGISFSKLVEVPLGKNGGNVQSLKFSTSGDGAPHALVIGGTGSGKSNLLHALVLSACYRYSPKELQIYLIDFKGGVEFKYYENNRLPHILLTGLTSEPEDGVAILTNIRALLRERENTFRRNNVEDIFAYNSLEGQEPMPRILVIIDEVQELFANERLSQHALTILGELFKKGRAFGIGILWASQTVPKASGDFRDKVLSQIGNRICLKLNNPDDAENIGISATQVRRLNRPEKGLGIIYDGSEFVEFRVAFASDDKIKDNADGKKIYRKDIVSSINLKWQSVVDSWRDRKPLFIVGDDAVPQASEGAEKYHIDSKLAYKARSNEEYALSIGQDYISGLPFSLNMVSKGSKENCWICGKDIEVLRDVIGYAMLSAATEQLTNTDIENANESIYYFNGELISKDKDDLFNVLPAKLGDVVKVASNTEELIESLQTLYKLRKERYFHSSVNHAPVFVFIHKLQFLAELFMDKKQYWVSDDPQPSDATPGIMPMGFANRNAMAGPSLSAGNTSWLTFKDIFSELWLRGSDVGIHFVVTINDPSTIAELRNEMRDCAHKVVLSGVSGDAVGKILEDIFIREKVPAKEGVAFYYQGNQMSKFKIYRYDGENDSAWLDNLLKKYR